jgi:hypothetical protein
MREAWEALLCRLDVHRWETVDVSRGKGWKCTRCPALVLEPEHLERVHDPNAASGPAITSGAAAGIAPPFM